MFVMRISDRGVASKILAGTVAVVMSSGFVGIKAAHAIDKQITAKEKMQFSSPGEAFRQGMGAFRAGRMDLALPALEYAAERKHLHAQIWLARIYASGMKNTNRNDVQAFKYYKLVADQLAEISPYNRYADVASEAFISVAQYYLNGIDALNLSPDGEKAARLYYHAAVSLQDPRAQYSLGRMYLEGLGVKKKVSDAVYWLLQAAKKNHAASQATLGDMLWYGKGVKKYPSKALALIELAKRNTSKEDRKWIAKLHKKMRSEALPELHKRAAVLVQRWEKQFGRAIVKRDTDKARIPGEKALTYQKAQPVAIGKDSNPSTSVTPILGVTTTDNTGGARFQNVGQK